jgi:hypothetical protein
MSLDFACLLRFLFRSPGVWGCRMAISPDAPRVKASDDLRKFCRLSERSVAVTPHACLMRYKIVFLDVRMVFYLSESQADASRKLRVEQRLRRQNEGERGLRRCDDANEYALRGKERWNSRALMIWQGSPRRAKKEALADLASACGKFNFGATVNSKRRVKFIQCTPHALVV